MLLFGIDEMSSNSHAQSSEGQVIADPTTIVLTDLAPGEDMFETVTVSNMSNRAVMISYESEITGPLAEGAHPIEVNYVWDLTKLKSCGDVPAIPAGETAALEVKASMPTEAGNEYQNIDGEAVLRFTYTECPEQPEASGLAATGAPVAASLMLAVTFLALGVFLLMRRRSGRVS